jgi:hypothetical protein
MGSWTYPLHRNKFFSPMIRIQNARGHRIIDKGGRPPPGYATAVAIQMWSELALSAALSSNYRTLTELDGHKGCAQRVRYHFVQTRVPSEMPLGSSSLNIYNVQ